MFGFLFTGVWQYALYVKLMPRLCPGALEFAAKPMREKIRDKIGIRNVLIQNFMENGINNPILYFPTFYTIQQYLDNKPLSGGIEKYRQNYKEDIPAILSVWVPAQMVNFTFSPPWFRVPFVACVSAFWTGYVSFTRGDFDGEKGSSSSSPQQLLADESEKSNLLHNNIGHSLSNTC